MRTRALAIAMALSALGVASCSGGSGSPGTSGGASSALKGALDVVVSSGGATAAHQRHLRYVPLSASSIAVAVSGVGQPVVADISSGSPLCSATQTGRACSVGLTAPSGSITFTATIYDGPNATGRVLSVGSATQTISGSGFSVAITALGNIAAVHLAAGQTTFAAGVPATTSLSAIALDADGNAITGTYLDPIALASSDTSGAFTLSAQSLTASGATITIAYNGSSATSGDTITPSVSGLGNLKPLTLSVAGAPSPSPAPSPSASPTPPPPPFQTLYSFQGGSDGAQPLGALLNSGGTLYGATYVGGGTGCGGGGCGTVYGITTAGAEKPLYSFQGGSDGSLPQTDLIDVGGIIYGTTVAGGGTGCGGAGCGTVFAIAASGEETVLYRFQGGSGDGQAPQAGLTYFGGALYGTTQLGGATGLGTVFKVTTSGRETLLHSFGVNGTDGQQPDSALIALKGTLYGETRYGGATVNGCPPYNFGCGTLFAVNPSSGAEKVVYSFTGGADGAYPAGNVIDLKGTLYGVTASGGGTGCGGLGCGTVFTATASGSEHPLYPFQGGTDGEAPLSLTDVDGTLYGATAVGGNGCPSISVGCGTLFAVTTAGVETVLHSFTGGIAGYEPFTQLAGINGVLYGSTRFGGTGPCEGSSYFGCGTVFSYSLAAHRHDGHSGMHGVPLPARFAPRAKQ